MASVVIYGKHACSFCEAAKGLCISRGIEMEYKSITDGDFTMDEFNELFAPARTFPQIILDGTHVGGYMDFLDATSEG
jgi:glutaredoxin